MFLVGLSYTKIRADEGEFGWKDVLRFNIYQILANVIAWIIVAPVLDIVIYAEPAARLHAGRGRLPLERGLLRRDRYAAAVYLRQDSPKKGSLSRSRTKQTDSLF